MLEEAIGAVPGAVVTVSDHHGHPHASARRGIAGGGSRFLQARDHVVPESVGAGHPCRSGEMPGYHGGGWELGVSTSRATTLPVLPAVRPSPEAPFPFPRQEDRRAGRNQWELPNDLSRGRATMRRAVEVGVPTVLARLRGHRKSGAYGEVRAAIADSPHLPHSP